METISKSKLLAAEKKAVKADIKADAKLMTNLQAVPIGERTKEKTLAETINKPNKTYSISKAYDLNGETVEIPKGVVLQFKDNGSISNGTLVGQNTIIHADRKVFYDMQIKGTWGCAGNVAWFADGSYIPESSTGLYYPQMPTDDTDGIQSALDSAFRELHFPPVPFYITRTLILSKEKRLVLHGSSMKSTMDECAEAVRNTAIIYSDKNITLLRIVPSELNHEGKTYQVRIEIEGGSFDVSKCPNYNSSCIQVIASVKEKIWGLVINSNIKANNKNRGGIGIDINPIGNRNIGCNEAFVTNVHINSVVSNFGTGIRAMNYQEGETYFNWCTDMYIDGNIINCECAIDTNADCDMRASIQSGYYYDQKYNGKALVRFTGERASISSNIYDIQRKGYGGWANENALEVTEHNAVVTTYGQFRTFYILSERLGWPMTKGTVY